MPQVTVDGTRVRVIAGNAYAALSPVSTCGDLFYVDARMPKGTALRAPDNHVQRAALVIDGDVHVGDESLQPGQLYVFSPGATVELQAQADSHVVMLGGAPLDAPRYMWWNYVASSPALIEQAQEGWAQKRFAMIAGDPEFIPLPEDRRVTLMIRPD